MQEVGELIQEIYVLKIRKRELFKRIRAVTNYQRRRYVFT